MYKYQSVLLIVLVLTLTIWETRSIPVANMMGSSGSGMGMGGGGGSRGQLRNALGRLSPAELHRIQTGGLMANSLPPGYALIDGQVMDASYKVIQRSVQAGTAYYSYYDKLQENPLYMRPGNEAGWHFVVFQDPYYWRGSGHIILLKKVLGVNINRFPTDSQTLYEAYLLSLRMPIHVSIHGMDAWTAIKLQMRKSKLDLITTQRMMHRASPIVPKLTGKNPLRIKRHAGNGAADSNNGENCYMKRLNVTKVYLDDKHFFPV